MKIAVACGGTGGHIFPGLQTARVLRGRGHELTLWLGGREVERTSVRGWDGACIGIPAEGLQSATPGAVFRFLRRLVGAFLECRRRMRAARPDVLLAMGSYASVGPTLAARCLGVPVVLHESNAIPGKAVNALARVASAVAVNFEGARALISHRRVVVTGFPLREGLAGALAGSERLRPGTFTVLVMGGSQGAHRLNELAVDAISSLSSGGADLQVVHLAGARDAEFVRMAYERAGVAHEVHAFLDDMGRAYALASLAVARSGAGTCAELSACGVPALLVPLPTAARDHQSANAAAMKATGGVDVLAERDLTATALADYLDRCRKSPEKLRAMRQALESHRVEGAADRLADLVESCARRPVK